LSSIDIKKVVNHINNGMSDRLFNLSTARDVFAVHRFSQEHQLRMIKVGPEPFNSEILRGTEYATTASLPGGTREAKEVPFAGSRLNYPGQLQIGSGTTTISWRAAQSFLIRNTFEKWMFADGNPLTGSGKFCTGDDATMQYVVVNNDGKPIRGYEFFGVFVSDLGEMQYNNESDNIVTFDVTLAYSFWQPLELDAIRLDVSNAPATQDKTRIFDDYEAEIAAREANPPEC
jgi:hypothetical protein